MNDITYYKPTSVDEAIKLYSEHENAYYISGGTELITSFRKNTIKIDTLIDLKSIEGFRSFSYDEAIYIGAGLTLNEVIDFVKEPQLTRIFDKIADHTTRNSLTIGGNICGRLPYKEAVLPLYILNAHVVVASELGLEEYPMVDLFDKRLKLPKGSFLYGIKLDQFERKIYSERLEESTVIDYPMIHLVMIKENKYKIALSGFSSFPVFAEGDFDELKVNLEKVARDTAKGSKAYKLHMVMDMIERGMKELEV